MSLELLSAVGERFLKPNSAFRYIPRNLFRIVVLLLFVEYAAKVLAGKVVTGSELLGWLVLALAIVIAVFAIFDGVEDEEAGDRKATWITRILGMIVVLLLFIISQGIWHIEATPYSNPSAVAIAANGNLFIADSGNNRVIEVPVNGTRLQIGSGLSNPSGVAPVPGSDSTQVYVADTNNNRVLRVSLQPHQAFGPLHGSGPYAYAEAATTQVAVGHGFSHPTGLATDPSGRLFVADTANNRIVEVLPNGTQSIFVSGLNGPLAVATDPFGNLYVANSSDGDVIRYTISANGTASAKKIFASDLARPAGVAADAQGNVYVSNTGENTVIEYSANGTHHEVEGEFNEPRGLGVDGQGHLYIANAGEGWVILSEPAYTATTTLVGPVAPATAAALGPDGSSWTVSSTAGTLEQITSSGSKVVSRSLDVPSGVAWSALHRLYVSQYGNGTIEQVDPATGTATVIASGLTGVTAIAPDAYGGLFAVEPEAGRLLTVSAQGEVKVLVSGLAYPTSVTQDAYGHIDVTLRGTKPGTGALWQIVLGGKAVILASGLSNPTNASADFDGNVFFIEQGTARIWEDRGLLGAQIVFQGSGTSTNPSAIAVSTAGNVTMFPEAPGRTVTISLSTTNYKI
jgi:sugar lactone lactonase YvrE